MAVPVHGEASPFILPSITEVVLTKLQEAALACLDTVQQVRVTDASSERSMNSCWAKRGVITSNHPSYVVSFASLLCTWVI